MCGGARTNDSCSAALIHALLRRFGCIPTLPVAPVAIRDQGCWGEEGICGTAGTEI